MIPRLSTALFACLVLLATPHVVAQDVEPPDGYTALFNGRDLNGWWGAETEDPRSYLALPAEQLEAKRLASMENIRAHWSAENGELVNDGQGLYLTTRENFGDFELRLEYKTVAGADSGIYLRGCPQVQIWDTTEAGGKWNIGADKGSGGLWNNTPGSPGKDPLAHADKPFGEWNAVRIIMLGERVTVWLNDTLVVEHARMHNYYDRALPIPAKGPIQLQTHGGEIRWRNIFIREIEPEEANDLLRQGGPTRSTGGIVAEYKPIFNGRDFTGWQGAVDDYVVRDGALMCRPGRGGVLYTNKAYGNFSVQLDIKLPRAGNNGLAIRYPGNGNPAYAGMCELQVLDNTSLKYASLDPRQYHGSAYGQVAAHRGYQRPVGTWNHQRVTVRDAQITVELNGTVILDADLNDVTDFMHGRDSHTGRDRTEGHFGFAGHNDAVAYRNIRIKTLD